MQTIAQTMQGSTELLRMSTGDFRWLLEKVKEVGWQVFPTDISTIVDAMEMFEQSYKAYHRAQQLDPTSVRLRNDCALIAIYHLERDWDEMKKLLEAAATDGQKILDSNPPEDPDERQNLDEAVGDCYENLALWHIKHSKDGAAAKAAALKSKEYYPGEERPGARRHLEAASGPLLAGAAYDGVAFGAAAASGIHAAQRLLD